MLQLSQRNSGRNKSMINKHTCSGIKKFCKHSSLLGLRYLAEPKRPFIEKLMWLLGLISAVVLCAILNLQVWNRWRNSSIITQHSVSDIPFPAVTFCPGAKVYESQMVYMEQNYNSRNRTFKTESAMRHLFHVCKEAPYIFEDSDAESDEVIRIIKKFSYKLMEYILNTYWLFSNIPVENFFKPIITEEGLCYTFNSLPGYQLFENNTFHHEEKFLDYDTNGIFGCSVQWNPGVGYVYDKTVLPYPFQLPGSGRQSAFFVRFHDFSSDESICESRNDGKGFSITVHSPADVARPSQRGVRVPHGAVVDVAVTPEAVLTDAAVRYAYTPSERQCFYPDERRLRFFVQYTQANCELECLANYTLRFCGCVAFYMPRERNTKVCNTFNSYLCVEFAEWKMNKMEANLDHAIGKSYSFMKHITEEEAKSIQCNCLQGCNHIDYNIEVSHHPVVRSESEWSQGNTYPILRVFYRNLFYFPAKRMEMFGTIDFIACCGGLLGLCLGFSVLTIVELIYWLFVRAFNKNSLGIKINHVAAPAYKESDTLGKHSRTNIYTLTEIF